MPETRRCPQCGTAIRPDAPEGLCPECLLREAMKSGSDPRATGTYTPGSIPPSLDELAKQFPQLEILELLGQGGMGIVYKARQPRLDRFVALKILPAKTGRDPAFAERFAREARALAKLTHPSIVAVYDFGQSDGRFYLLMEFVDGVNLRHLLRERRLKPEEALKIVPQICEALQYAHDQGVIHRDIKPENILLAKTGRIKIADFGLAKLLGRKASDSALTGSQQVMGTPHYMAPEQMEKPLAVDHRADIYSLGVVFYEMLTGELPLGRFAPPSQKVQVDVRLDEVVLRALEKEPERRYQHASDLKTEVESITTGTPATAPKAGPQRVPDPVLFKRVTVLTLMALVLWNMAFAALNWGYIARAEWYFRKELPYEWLQSLWWASTLVCLGFGSWWFYLLVKRPGTPRSFEDYCRVWLTSDRRTRSAWGWFGLWITAMASGLLCLAFEENVPLFWVMQGVLGLTPIALMAALWCVVRRGGPNAGRLAVGTRQAGSPQVRVASSEHGILKGAKAEELERLVLSLMPNKELAAIRAYVEQAGVPLDHAAAAVEAIARRHGITPRPVPLWPLRILLLMAIVGAGFVGRKLFFPDISDAVWWVVILMSVAVFLMDVLRSRRQRQGLQVLFAFLGGVVCLLTYVILAPEPLLAWLYDITGSTPGKDDVAASRLIMVLIAFWLAWLMVQVRYRLRARQDQPVSADAQAMKFLRRKVQSLWASALSLCFGSRVEAACTSSESSYQAGSVGDSPIMPGKPTSSATSAPSPTNSDLERIQGTWIAVSAEAAGWELAETEVKRIAMTFQGDKVKVKGLKKNDEEDEGTFRLDPTQKPKRFDLAVANKRMPGIYMLEADSLRICFNQNDGGERPKTFATDRETEFSLVVLKRQS